MPRYSRERKLALGREARAAVSLHGSKALAAKAMGISYPQLFNRLAWAQDEAEAPRDLWSEFKANPTIELRNKLVVKYLPLVKKVASVFIKKCPKKMDFDDLVGCGSIGLLQAIESFDLDRGVTFETYAPGRIKGAMYDMLRDNDPVPRLARKRSNEVNSLIEQGVDEQQAIQSVGATFTDISSTRVTVASLHDVLAVNGNGNDFFRGDISGPVVIHRGHDRHRRCDAFESFVRGLLFDEKVLLWLYHYEGRTMSEIARAMNISESRVSQLHKSAITWLKQNREAAI